MNRIAVGLIGCGAVAEQYYAPALRALERTGCLAVTSLTDRDDTRCERLRTFFPTAKKRTDLPGTGEIQLGIVATPARYHAAHAISLLESGIAVLCEKPLATTVADAERINAVARARGLPLAVGLFRRFFPALQMVDRMLRERTFGRLQRFAIQEGGPFNWPAATASFFDREQAGGGVLLDAGVHVLDVLSWWLGEPAAVDYADDAAGGVEAACRLDLTYGGRGDAVTGTVLLSRDWRTTNTWTLEFERGTVEWRAGEADRLAVRPAGSAQWLAGQLTHDGPPGCRDAADTYQQAFTRQLVDVAGSVAGGPAPRVTGELALASLRLIERCYRERRPLNPGEAE